MAEQITNYQCPSCTGPLHYAGASGKLECDYCGTSFDVAEIEGLYAEKEKQAAGDSAEEKAAAMQNQNIEAGEWDASGISSDWGADANEMKSYTCPSCGAELICDVNTAATACPYCGNPAIVPGQFSGTLRPDFVIPFKLNKEDAIRALKEHYKGKLFLPKTFTSENVIRKIQGVYVPFWMFDGEASGNFKFKAARSHLYKRGEYEITETMHYDVCRAGKISFEKIPVDASSKMPDNHMDSIEPYDYRELKPFSTAYLPGFLADKYDVSIEESYERADLRCKNTLEAALRDTIPYYDTCICTSSNTHLQHGKVHYAFMPVWMLNTRWKGKEYPMNGQTGKLVGDLPVSWGKFWGLFAAISLPLSILGSVISFLLV